MSAHDPVQPFPARTEGASPRRATVVATPRLLLALRITPLLGLSGAALLQHGVGREGDGCSALGLALVLGAIVGFQLLRLRLIAQFEALATERGASPARAAARALCEADLLLDSVRDADPLRSPPAGETPPPVSRPMRTRPESSPDPAV